MSQNVEQINQRVGKNVAIKKHIKITQIKIKTKILKL